MAGHEQGSDQTASGWALDAERQLGTMLLDTHRAKGTDKGGRLRKDGA